MTIIKVTASCPEHFKVKVIVRTRPSAADPLPQTHTDQLLENGESIEVSIFDDRECFIREVVG